MSESITIERDGDNLKCLAPPKPMWPVYLAAAFCALIMFLVFAQMFSGGYDEWTLYHNYTMGLIYAAVWLALAIPVVLIVISSYKRRKMLCGIIIENSLVKIYAPELSNSMRELPRIEVVGSYMRARSQVKSIASGNNRVNMYLSLRGGKSMLAMIDHPAWDLKRVVDTINSMVVVQQHHGFEVVLDGGPQPMRVASGFVSPEDVPLAQTVRPVVAMPALPVSQPAKILQVIPVDPPQEPEYFI